MYFLGRLMTLRQALKGMLVVLSSFNFLSLLTLLLRPRQLWYLSEDVFACFNERVRSPKVPVRQLAEILPAGSDPTSVQVSLERTGKTSLTELLCLCALAKVSNAKNILEIGTFTGGTAYHLAKNSRDDCRVFTMDLAEGFRKAEALRDARRMGKRYTDLTMIQQRPARETLHYMGTDVEQKVVQIYADSATYDYGANFREKFSLIFIDGAHDYEHARIDSANAMEWVADNGFVVWHDYNLAPQITYGVVKRINELSREYNIFRIAGTMLCVFHNVDRRGPE